MKKELQEILREEEKELEEDLEIILQSIIELQKTKPENWVEEVKKCKKIQEQLERNLESVQSQLDPVMQDSDHDSFMLITDRMINETINEYFKYHIWTHPDMVQALEDFSKNGPAILDKYSDDVRKWMVIFNAKKYKNDQENILKEWIEHKTWVCCDDHSNPFSFQNCVEYRGIIEPEKMRKYLDELATWSLEQLIARYSIFHAATQRQEKENIFIKRTEKNSRLQEVVA